MELRAGAPDEHFLRGQRRRTRPARRLGRAGTRRVALLLGIVSLVGAFVWAAAAMSRAPELSVHRIRVEGNERLSDGEILELLELTSRSNILTLDLEEVRQKLLRSAWVREVAIERVLPATLTLAIEERRPVAIAVLDALYLLAADGTILDELSADYEIESLLLVQGLAEDDGISLERAALAGRIAAALGEAPHLAAAVSEIDVTGGQESIALRLREPPVTVLASEEDLVDRLTETFPLLNGLTVRFPALEVVDLRFRDRAYLKLAEPEDTGGASF
ncbi:MAG TPA: FtsQ-type POTRA domain-containing protein [Vicinamibacteria bacterium]|nr:FtsQ-type POTRA domain-containing protein [Vicinamibacteria bacterium]